jgi:hypothetical protein
MIKFICAALILAPSLAFARGPVPFDGTWERITFPFQTATRFDEQGDDMMIAGDGSVSIAWRHLDQAFWSAEYASWTVDVMQSVPATDLSQKGGDDRNLSLYFVFANDDTAARAQRGASLSRLLGRDDVRVLLYVFGGAAARGAQFDSPYMDGKGRVIVKAPAKAGTFSEEVNLVSDFAEAFSGPRGNLIGVALSTDSDDTDTKVRAMVSDLILR